MIARWNHNDVTPLLSLWLESTIAGHPFIEERYWHESQPLVQDVYLPSARTWVWQSADVINGFISVMDARFVGALFVRPSAQGQGIGGALLNHVKQHFPILSLEVYQKNCRAVNFYHAQGFRIEDSAWQEETQHPTWIMSWQAGQTPSA